MVSQLDFGYVSEMVTRYSMLLSTELTPFLGDMRDLFFQEYIDWYLVGMRWGLLWKVMFDVKLE